LATWFRSIQKASISRLTAEICEQQPTVGDSLLLPVSNLGSVAAGAAETSAQARHWGSSGGGLELAAGPDEQQEHGRDAERLMLRREAEQRVHAARREVPR